MQREAPGMKSDLRFCRHVRRAEIFAQNSIILGCYRASRSGEIHEQFLGSFGQCYCAMTMEMQESTDPNNSDLMCGYINPI